MTSVSELLKLAGVVVVVVFFDGELTGVVANLLVLMFFLEIETMETLQNVCV